MCLCDTDDSCFGKQELDMIDLKNGDTVQITLIMLQAKYQINPTYTSQEIFETFKLKDLQMQVHMDENKMPKGRDI